jgi:hypothetical protein
MRIGVALDERKVLNDSGTAQSTNCPLRDRDLRLALHFRELRAAVPGETEEEPSSTTDSCNMHEPLKRKRRAFVLEISRLIAIAGSAVLAWGLLLGSNLFPANGAPGVY